MSEADLDLEEDIVAELENFVLHARLRIDDEAVEIIDNVLSRHLHQLPVLVEVSGFLVEQGDVKMIADLLQQLITDHSAYADQAKSLFVNNINKYAQGKLGGPTIVALKRLHRHTIDATVEDNASRNVDQGLRQELSQYVLPPVGSVDYSSPVEVRKEH